MIIITEYMPLPIKLTAPMIPFFMGSLSVDAPGMESGKINLKMTSIVHRKKDLIESFKIFNKFSTVSPIPSSFVEGFLVVGAILVVVEISVVEAIVSVFGEFSAA